MAGMTGGKYDSASGWFDRCGGLAFLRGAPADADDLRGGRDADCEDVLGRRSASTGGAGGGGGFGKDFGRDCFLGGGGDSLISGMSWSLDPRLVIRLGGPLRLLLCICRVGRRSSEDLEECGDSGLATLGSDRGLFCAWVSRLSFSL